MASIRSLFTWWYMRVVLLQAKAKSSSSPPTSLGSQHTCSLYSAWLAPSPSRLSLGWSCCPVRHMPIIQVSACPERNLPGYQLSPVSVFHQSICFHTDFYPCTDYNL